MEKGVTFVPLPERERRIDHLPPLEFAPVLGHLSHMSLDEFRETHGIDTPVHHDGTVDHQKLVKQVRSLVSPDYQWRAPFFDEHHLYWPNADYDIPTRKIESTLFEENILARDALGTHEFYLNDEILEAYEDSLLYKEMLAYANVEAYMPPINSYALLAQEFREVSLNKLWVPREFHNFIHTVTRPPEVPEIDVMKRNVKEARRRQYLYQIASNAITIREKLDRSVEVPLPKGGTLLVDKQIKRAYQDPDDMRRRRAHFIAQILTHHRDGLINLQELLPLEAVDSRSVEESLIAMAPKFLGKNIVKTRASRRAIRVELPFQVVEALGDEAA